MPRVLASVLAAAAIVAAPSGAEAATWVVKGAGWGHGVGMSAYGAYGYGLNGWSAGRILRHYYAGIETTALDRPRSVRVLLRSGVSSVTFSGATAACGRALRPGRAYRAAAAGGSVALQTTRGTTVARCARLRARGGRSGVRVAGVGAYRGDLVVTPGLTVVNRLELDDYVQGVMPGEIPAGWPAETLKAFAIAMRSIALTSSVGGNAYDVYPDTRSQVYKGKGAETPQENAAVAATRNRVATYAGEIAQTTYFSSSGGQTESGFLGQPEVPYLQSEPDPYDTYAPLHRWTLRFTQAQMDAKLAPYLKGRLRRVEVTERGDTPRIERARLVGTGGTTTVDGDQLRAALGLYERWAYFSKR